MKRKLIVKTSDVDNEADGDVEITEGGNSSVDMELNKIDNSFYQLNISLSSRVDVDIYTTITFNGITKEGIDELIRQLNVIKDSIK